MSARFFLIVAGAVFLGLAACQQSGSNSDQGASADQAGPVKGLDRRQKGKAAPETIFNDPEGGEISLAEFRGVPVLVNLWATWCAPCVKELPTLERLAEKHAAAGQLGVIAVSQDAGPQPSVAAFLEKLNVRHIGAYHDPKMALSGALGAEVLPTTILYDAQGRELWRYVGDLDWTGPEAARLLEEAKAAASG